MPSSPTAPADTNPTRHERLLEALEAVPDPRDRRDGKAPHLVAAFDHGAGAVPGQVAVDMKSNEIPAARTLLGHLDLDGAVVTLDAMHTQTDTATAITGAGGDYLLTEQRHAYMQVDV